jgi:peptidoglycan/LPS O-acetylase OafA/YrhL
MVSLASQYRTTVAAPDPAYRVGVAYIPALDGLRGVAVLLVLFFHGQLPGFKYGYIGVDIFFVLSGYLITTLLIAEYKHSGTISFAKFYHRRVCRLFPALLMSLSIFVAYAAVILPNFSTHLVDAADALTYVYNWTRAFALARSAQIGHTWSLGIEEQFYLAWPALCAFLLARFSGRAPLAVACVLVATTAMWRLHLAVDGAAEWRLYNGFDTRCDALFVGCALAFTPAVGRAWPIGAAALLLFMLFGLQWNSRPMFMGGYTALAIAAAPVIAGASESSRFISKFLALKPLVAVGRISYGLYIFHLPIYGAMQDFQAGIFPLYLNTVALSATFAIATFSYLYVERPILDRRNTPAFRRAIKYTAAAGPLLVCLGLISVAWRVYR